jgi:hypothetical protein
MAAARRVLSVAGVIVVLAALALALRGGPPDRPLPPGLLDAIAAGRPPQPELLDAVRPVVPTTLEAGTLQRIFSGGNHWRNLSLSLSAEEEAAIARCVSIAHRANTYSNQASEFEKDQTGRDLEEILKARPDLFYAEYLLGHWHRLRGESEQARRWLRRAYEHAPAILIQRYRYTDGRPVAASHLIVGIECNRVEHGALNPTPELHFGQLTTDADGCVYLPVYRTVYRRGTYSWPADHEVQTARLGWFETAGRIGEMPVFECRRRDDIVVTRDPLKPCRSSLRWSDVSRTPDKVSFSLTVAPADPAEQRFLAGWYAIEVPDGRVSWSGGVAGSEMSTRPVVFEFAAALTGESGVRLESGSRTDPTHRYYAQVGVPVEDGRGRIILNDRRPELTQQPIPLVLAAVEKDGRLQRVHVGIACVVGHGNEGKDARLQPPDLKADTELSREIARLVEAALKSTATATDPE